MKDFIIKISFIFLVFSSLNCPNSNGGETSPTQPTSALSNPTKPVDIQKELDNVVKQILKLTQKIPQKDKSYIAGKAYNTYIKENFGPLSEQSPLELQNHKEINKNSVIGIGTYFKLHKTENGEITLAIDPHKGSPAETDGLKKGDLIVSIDDFDIRKTPESPKNFSNLFKRLRGPIDSQVKLKVLDACSHQEKEVVVTRGPVIGHFHWSDWLANSRFVNLTRQEPLDCESQEKTTKIPNEQQEPAEFSSVEPQAFYLPLKSFFKPPKNIITPFITHSLLSKGFHGIENLPLCAQFIFLQHKDLENPYSLGMIIDLRGNTGGNFYEAPCMLNTIISSKDVIARHLPIGDVRLLKNAKNVNYHFTDGGTPSPIVDPFHSLVTYNRNIVVLVDKDSASASEVFAGILQDMKRGWVIGDRTMGKGTVQVSENMVVESKSGKKANKPLKLSLTMGIYTLNSGRSPQGYGIIPDFRFSLHGKPIEKEADYISPMDRLFFSNIQFENDPWEQNRPDEMAELSDCVNKPDRLNQILKKKIREDKRYARPFVGDYHLELAKDILSCSPQRPDVITHTRLSPPFLTVE